MYQKYWPLWDPLFQQQYIFIHDCVASVLKDRSEYTSLRNMDYVDKDYGAIYEDLDIEEDIYEGKLLQNSFVNIVQVVLKPLSFHL